VETTGDFAPREEQTRTLESCIKWFNDVKWVGIRSKIILGFFPVCAVLILSVLFAHLPMVTKIQWTGGLIGFTLLTPVMYLLVSGLTQKTYLLAKVRQFLFGAGIIGWMIGLVIGVLAVLILIALNLLWFWLAFSGAALVTAMALHFLVDPMIVRDRRGAIDNLETLLKGLRGRGVPEPAIEQFVCKYGGENWEEIYETLFGYESKMIAREKWGKLTSGLGRTGVGDRGRARAKYAAWRDPIIAWIDEKEKFRRAARERRHLEKIEAASLRAKGFGESAARKKAKRTAESLVIKAGELREEAMEHLLQTVAPPTEEVTKTEEPKPQESPLSEEAMEKRKKKKVGADDEGLEGWEQLSYFQRRYGGWQGFFLGSLVRFGLGAFLLFGGLLWAHQNNLLKAENATALLRADAEKTFVNGEAVKVEGPIVETPAETHPLDLKGVPAVITNLFDHWAVPLAGLLLLLSAIFQGTNLGVFMIPAAAIMVIAPHYGLPGVGPLSPHAVGAMIGVLGSMAGLMLARK
jgi:hypothetical protein